MKQYLLISSVYLAVFYLIYILLISRDTRYRRNRLYLLGSILISLILPFAKINAGSGGLFASFSDSIDNIVNIPGITVYADDPGRVHAGLFSLPFIIYLSGCLVAFLILLTNILKLTGYIRKYGISGSKIVITPSGKESGFSAMGYIFLSSNLKTETKSTILEHEQQHINSRHFIDISLLRFLGVFFWFNPFIYLYDRSLRALHEFEADEQMINAGRNVVSYQRLILNQIFNTSIFTLQNGFSGRSLIKKRMIMMTKKRSKKMSALKLILAVPVVLFVFIFFSCTNDEISPLDTINEAENPAQLSEQPSKEIKSLQEIWEDSPALQEKPKSNVQYADPKYINDEIFVVVEDMPTFQGGDVNVFRLWVQRNVKYPPEAVKEGIQGKVFIMFVVDEKGQLTQPEILRGVDPSLDEEVLRVVSASPMWSAGLQKGIPVKVRFSITVNFQLQ